MNPNKILKYSKVAFNYYNNKKLTKKSISNKKMYIGPWTAHLMLTYKCNCNCMHCPPEIAAEAKWENDSELLTLAEYYKLIDQLVEAKCYRIICEGGEPLIYKDKLLKILEKINERAYSQIVTNGLMLDEEFLKTYNEAGGGHITLSVDGLHDLHDQIRRKEGLFQKIEDTICFLQGAKFQNIFLKATFVLFNENIHQLIPVINYFVEKNIPIFIQPYDSYQRKFSLEECRKNPLWIQENNINTLENSIQKSIFLKKKYPHLIINSERHLLKVKDYFLNPQKINNECYFNYRMVYITPYGEVDSCFGKVDSIRNKSFFDIWNSQEFHDIRKAQLNCHKNCLLGCTTDHSFYELFRLAAYQLFKVN